MVDIANINNIEDGLISKWDNVALADVAGVNGLVPTVATISEDFLLYTEEDDSSKVTITKRKITFTGIQNNHNTWVYYDKGSDYLREATIDFEFEITASQTDCTVCVLAASDTAPNDWQGMLAATRVYAWNNAGNLVIGLSNVGNGGGNDTYAPAAGATIARTYARLVKDIQVFTLYLYSDSARTVLLDTLTITINADRHYRYFYALMSNGDAGTATMSGYTQNVNIYGMGIYQDLTGYTVVDPDSDFTVVADRIDISSLRRDRVSYIVYDFGASYFGDFTIQFEGYATAGAAAYFLTALSNTLGAGDSWATANDGLIVWHAYVSGAMFTQINCYGTDNSDKTANEASPLGPYYYTWTRTSSTMTLYVYDDRARTSLYDTLTITSAADRKRYLYAVAGRNDGNSATISGYVQYFKIVSAG